MVGKKEMMRKLVMQSMKSTGRKILRDFDRSTEHAYKTNKALLQRLLKDNANTEYGQKYNFADIKSISEYRNTVPLTTYDDYEEYIDRMTEKGERNLISAYPVVYYASTSGTSGSPKKIPVSDKGLKVFRDYSTATMFGIVQEFYKNTKGKDSKDGAALVLLSLAQTPLKDGVNFGSISAACLEEDKLKYLSYFATTPKEVMFTTQDTDLKYLHARYALAERDLAYLAGAYIPSFYDLACYIRENWQSLVEDIRFGKLDEMVQIPEDLRETLQKSLMPDPERADELTKIFEKGFDSHLMKRIWPKLTVVASIWAGNFSSYARKLQEYTGRSLPYHTQTYVSSEGVFGMARHPFDQCYALIPKSCFYEFIPMDGKKDDVEEENPETVLIDDVEQGKEYELVITNQSGFYRYRMGDVIKVIGFYNETPLVVFKYRKKNIVSIAGEKFTEDHLLSAVREFERRTNINVIDFCMYPDLEAEPGRYVIMLEPEKPVPESRKEECTAIMAEELARASTSYAHYVTGGNMGEPKLVFLQGETFLLHRELKMYKTGLSENQLKTARVLTTPELKEFFTKLEEK